MATEEQLYEFDLTGYLSVPSFLPVATVAAMNALIDEAERSLPFWVSDAEPFKFLHTHSRPTVPVEQRSLLALDPLFMELMAEPRAVALAEQLTGCAVRLDHSMGVQMDATTALSDGVGGLHGGPGWFSGQDEQQTSWYTWQDGAPQGGDIVFMYLLEDVPPGAGGLIIVPASHKANMSHTPALDSRVVENPAGRAGDLLVFTVSPPALHERLFVVQTWATRIR